MGEARRKQQQRLRDALAIRDAQDELLQKNIALYSKTGHTLGVYNSHPNKMSEVLIEYADPLLQAAGDDVASKKKALMLAMAIWNIGLLPDADQISECESFLNTIPATSGQERCSQEYRSVALFLLKRKHEQFSHVQRLILDLNFVATTDGFHVNVISTAYCAP